MMKPIFLSASIPDPRRDPRFYDSADITAISEAVIGLATVVVPHRKLVFGGHPAISPLVRFVAERAGKPDNVVIYQSRFFEDKIPPDSLYFNNLVWTEAVPQENPDQAMSLAAMRDAMVGSEAEYPFGAGVFIGGMEGVLEEFVLFREFFPQVVVYPMASTGGASLILWEKEKETLPYSEVLKEEFEYISLFTHLFVGLEGNSLAVLT